MNFTFSIYEGDLIMELAFTLPQEEFLADMRIHNSLLVAYLNQLFAAAHKVHIGKPLDCDASAFILIKEQATVLVPCNVQVQRKLLFACWCLSLYLFLILSRHHCRSRNKAGRENERLVKKEKSTAATTTKNLLRLA